MRLTGIVAPLYLIAGYCTLAQANELAKANKQGTDFQEWDKAMQDFLLESTKLALETCIASVMGQIVCDILQKQSNFYSKIFDLQWKMVAQWFEVDGLKLPKKRPDCDQLTPVNNQCTEHVVSALPPVLNGIFSSSDKATEGHSDVGSCLK